MSKTLLKVSLAAYVVAKGGFLWMFFTIENVPFYVIGAVAFLVSILIWKKNFEKENCLLIGILCGLVAVVAYGNLDWILEVSGWGYAKALVTGVLSPLSVVAIRWYEDIEKSIIHCVG